MAKRTRQKACDRCTQGALVLYRVRWEVEPRWQFVCGQCYPTFQRDHPHYIYGGTWKATKSR